MSLKSLRNPVEILLPGADFKMQFAPVDAEFHFGEEIKTNYDLTASNVIEIISTTYN